MADFKELKRIYRIEAPGLDLVTSKVQQLNSELELQKAIKKEASKVLSANPNDAAVIERQTKVIAQSEVAIKRLTAEKRIAVKEGDALIKNAEKQAKAEIDQGNAAKYAATSVNEAAANYKALLAIARESPKDGFINWKGEVLTLEQAKTKLLEYRHVVDDFNRSLSPDGTLVGEYKTGILNAFKDLGLTDLIKDQKFKIEREISDLIVKNQQLVANYKEAGKVGPEAFRAMEPALERNLKRQQELENQLRDINGVLKQNGTIGKEVTGAIANGFNNIVTAGLGFAGISLGISQVFSFLGDANEEFQQAELNTLRLRNALRNTDKERYFDELIGQANELAQQIGYLDNDDIVKAQEKLVTFGKLTAGQIKQLLPTIIELAANLGVSVPEATGIIIKALGGAGKALKEYGVEVKSGNTLLENFNIIQTQLKGRVEGSSGAMLELKGSTAQTDQEIKNLQEEIGSKSGPAWANFKKAIFEGINGLVSFDETLTNLVERSPVFRKLFFFTDEVKAYNLTQQMKNTPLGQYQEQLKITTSTLPSLIAELNSKSVKEQEEYIKNQEIFISAARQDYIDLKNSSTATQTQISQAAARLDGYKKVREELQKQLDKNKNDKPAFTADIDPEEAKEQAEKAAKDREDRRKKAQEKRLRDIDREETEALIALERKRADGLIKEEAYEAELYQIGLTAKNKRVDVYSDGLEEEQAQAAKIRLDIIKDEQEYNNKLFEFVKQRIENEKQGRIAAAKDIASQVTDDPLATPLQKAEAQKLLNETLLKIEKDSNKELLSAEETYHKQSEENQRQRGEQEKEIQRNINADMLQITKEGLAERLNIINEEESEAIANRALKLRDQISDILGSKKSNARKSQLIDRTKDQASLDVLDIELDAERKKLEVYKEMLKNKQISEVEFDNFKARLLEKEQLRIEKANKLELEKLAEKQKIRNAILQSAEQILNEFLQAKFEQDEARLNREKDAQIERLDREKEQVLAQAQSAQERESIEKQYEVKRKEIDKQAGERMKQQKLKELAILTAVGVGQALASSPFPINLINAAAVLLMAAIQKGQINAQTFADGGQAQRMFPYKRLSSGIINVAPNVTPLPNGDNVLAYVKPGEVILNEEQQRRAGGAAFFRRLGVPGFALGGRVPGEGLSAPINPSSYLSNDNTSAFQGIGAMLSLTNDYIEATNRRIDKLVVVQDPRASLMAQNKVIQNDKVGSL